jgi:hypothetical protein
MLLRCDGHAPVLSPFSLANRKTWTYLQLRIELNLGKADGLQA